MLHWQKMKELQLKMPQILKLPLRQSSICVLHVLIQKLKEETYFYKPKILDVPASYRTSILSLNEWVFNRVIISSSASLVDYLALVNVMAYHNFLRICSSEILPINGTKKIVLDCAMPIGNAKFKKCWTNVPGYRKLVKSSLK